MKKNILQSVKDGIEAITQLQYPESISFIEQTAHLIANAFKSGNKVIIAGNGGSLCDASHFAEELTGFFRKKRPALPAIALSDPGHITCVGNDVGFDQIFSRGVEALGKRGDVFVGLTTSGNSKNVIEAFTASKKLGLKTVAFLGKDGGKIKGVADLEIIITGVATTDRIQEAHMTAIHIIIEMIEEILFSDIDKPMHAPKEKVSLSR
jgi:D-sedoheptulose 7-phosphate isomerase